MSQESTPLTQGQYNNNTAVTEATNSFDIQVCNEI
jgi:hypothetical protein